MGVFVFGPFRLDLADEMLRGDEEVLPLTPKAYNVLRFLLENAGTLVTKRMLLNAIWPDAVVGDAVLKVAVREIRQRLGDDSRDPDFIQTVHRRGYRFIHEVEELEGRRAPSRPAALRPETRPKSDSARVPASLPLPTAPPGRDELLERLGRTFRESAMSCGASVVLSGPAGIGKSHIFESFCPERAELAETAEMPPFVLRGRCIETLGEVEGLSPLLAAMGEAMRDGAGEYALALLRRYAPTCLSRLPALWGDDDGLLRELALGPASARMQRELVDWFAACARQGPVLLGIEDLHWADPATLDVVLRLAARPVPGLMLLLTWRPDESEGQLVGVHRELRASEKAELIELEPLNEESVAEFLRRRGHARVSPSVLRFVTDATEGHPLFLVLFTDELEQRGVDLADETAFSSRDGRTAEAFLPRDVEHMIRTRLSGLSPEELAVFEAASVACAAGTSFSSESVGAALQRNPEEIESLLDASPSARRFLEPAGTLRFEGGVIAPSYRFGHALYRKVLYAGLSESRRIRAHLRIVSHGEELYAERSDEIAHEMAVHFERGGDAARAAERWETAARLAAQESRWQDAARCLHRALDTARAADLAEKDRARIHSARGLLRRHLGQSLEAERDFAKAEALAKEAEDLEGQIEAALYRSSVLFWSDPRQAIERAVDAAHSAAKSAPELTRDDARAYASHLRLNFEGYDPKLAADCRRGIEAARKLDDMRRLAFHRTRDIYLSSFEGRYDEAEAAARESEPLNRDQGNGFDHTLGLFLVSWASLHDGRWGETLERVDRGLALAERNGHRAWSCLFGIMRAQVMVEIGAYEEATELCQEASMAASLGGGAAGQIHWHADIVAAAAEMNSGELAAARQRLDSLERALAESSAALDSILRFPLERVRSELALREGDEIRCLESARTLRSLAQKSGELSYELIARGLLLAGGEHDADDNEGQSAWARLAAESKDRPFAARALESLVPEHDKAAEVRRALRSAGRTRLAAELGEWPEFQATLDSA